jgi:prepilin-type N-terminal cleavage/methylation domain-containing protein
VGAPIRSWTAARFTLLELVVTIALVSILAGMGWVSTRDQLPRYRLQKAAKMLRLDLSQLRNEAIYRGLETRIVFMTSGNACDGTGPPAGSWLLQIGNAATNSTVWDTFPSDRAEDGTDDETGPGTVDLTDGARSEKSVCLRDWGALNAAPNEDALIFSPRGWLRNPDVDYQEGLIAFTLVGLDARQRGRTEEVDVFVAKSGMTTLQTRYGN